MLKGWSCHLKPSWLSHGPQSPGVPREVSTQLARGTWGSSGQHRPAGTRWTTGSLRFGDQVDRPQRLAWWGLCAPPVGRKLVAVQVCGLGPQRLGLEEPLGLRAPFPTVNKRRMNSVACWAFPRPASDSMATSPGVLKAGLRGWCRCEVSSSPRGTTSPFSLGREAGASPTRDTGQEVTDPGSELRPV